jgi:hypothetical protein
MLLSATAYNIKKLLKHASSLVQTSVAHMNKELKTSLKSLFIHLKVLLQLNNKLYNQTTYKRLFYWQDDNQQ